MLGVIAVSWLFTSADRQSRKNYINTRANLFCNILEIAFELFKEFNIIDDYYVMEGILSAIHGAAVYSESLGHLRELALEIDNQIFNKSEAKEIYPNVLVRDYARHIIEYSLQKDDYLPDDIQLIKARITPPYKSSFPEVTYFLNTQIKNSVKQIIILLFKIMR
ncbi:hypothetical protein ACLSZ7_08580 [Avibacterium gallinarum]|uniref:hypothetical protein n=1 Tax=Avibacterium gallinarum TaxID=755 RepID=UPI003BF7E9C5